MYCSNCVPSFKFDLLFFDKFASSSCLLLVSAGYYFDFYNIFKGYKISQ